MSTNSKYPQFFLITVKAWLKSGSLAGASVQSPAMCQSEKRPDFCKELIIFHLKGGPFLKSRPGVHKGFDPALIGVCTFYGLTCRLTTDFIVGQRRHDNLCKGLSEKQLLFFLRCASKPLIAFGNPNYDVAPVRHYAVVGGGPQKIHENRLISNDSGE